MFFSASRQLGALKRARLSPACCNAVRNRDNNMAAS